MLGTGTRRARGAPHTFLSRLARDVGGNVMYLTAGVVIPLGAMAGGAVDLSRAYLVKARMQQACDAGALAARRSMVGKILTDADKAEGYRYFTYNFPNGTMGSEPLAQGNAAAANHVVVTNTAEDQVAMAATTDVPTTLLRLADIEDIRVGVNCEAEEYLVNNDIMLVLDTTGSMNCTISDPTTCGQEEEKEYSKMWELREAVKKLYVSLRPAQEALEKRYLRMRIGFVMYSSNVNVGKLIYAANPAYINNPATVYRNSSGTLVNAGTKTASWFTGTGASDWNGCIIERETAPISDPITSSTTSIPSSALDLDIATLPSSTASRWSPHIPSAYVKNNLGYSNYAASDLVKGGWPACVHPAVHMKKWDNIDQFNAYVDTIKKGRGGTYHDIGMIWGTRMIANTGIFGNLNPDTWEAVKVKRTIVLVTDGTMAPNADVYGAYGVERYDGHIHASATSNSAEYKARHEKRFNLMCNRAKEMKIDVWVVAILDDKTAMTPSLTNCANANQAKKVSDTADLEKAFKQIADKVGNLRIGS